MKLYTEIVEVKKEQSLQPSELQDYQSKMKKKLPANVELVLTYLTTFNIGDKETVEAILKASKSSMKSIAKNLNMQVDEVEDMQKLLKNLGDDIRLLPMYMSAEERQDVAAGKKPVEDMTLDLETEKGRQACAKQYAKLVVAIASKYKGKSGLDWNGLLSAGQLGLVKAMSDYRKPEDYIDADTSIDAGSKEEAKTQKRLSFKQYAGWRIKQSILNDINNLSRTVRITQHEFQKQKNAENSKGSFNTISIDQHNSEERDITNKIPQLATTDHEGQAADEEWKKVYGLIDKQFNARTASCFYKWFGLNGFKQQKQLEIAKELGVTSQYVGKQIKAVLAFLQKDPHTMNILRELVSMYSESILIANYNKDKETIQEAFINDELFIMLEELTHWQDKVVYNNAVGSALECFEPEQNDFLMDCLYRDFNFIDENYAANKKLFISFLEHLYPTECIKKRTDVEILSRMGDICDLFKKHNLND